MIRTGFALLLVLAHVPAYAQSRPYTPRVSSDATSKDSTAGTYAPGFPDTRVTPPSARGASGLGDGGVADSYFCLRSHDDFPLSVASPNQCKFKSTQLKTQACTCGSYTYYDTYYVNMPSYTTSTGYDQEQNLACRGYDGYYSYCYNFGCYSYGYCAY